jgi:hypothetical protein
MLAGDRIPRQPDGSLCVHIPAHDAEDSPRDHSSRHGMSLPIFCLPIFYVPLNPTQPISRHPLIQ